MSTSLTIHGLSKLDAEELRDTVGIEGVALQEPPTPEGTLAEPATITAVIVLGSIALGSLAAWLCKKRRNPSKRMQFKVTKPSGETVEVMLSVDGSTEEPCKENVLEQLGKLAKAAVGAGS